MNDTEIVWNSPDSSDGERGLKQHGFVSVMANPVYRDPYPANLSLCKRISLSDGYKKIPIEEIEPEVLNEEKACKICLKIFKTFYQ